MRLALVARWRSPLETRGEQHGWAELTIVWFQQEFAMPVDPEVAAHIQSIDWQAQAVLEEP